MERVLSDFEDLKEKSSLSDDESSKHSDSLNLWESKDFWEDIGTNLNA